MSRQNGFDWTSALAGMSTYKLLGLDKIPWSTEAVKGLAECAAGGQRRLGKPLMQIGSYWAMKDHGARKGGVKLSAK